MDIHSLVQIFQKKNRANPRLPGALDSAARALPIPAFIPLAPLKIYF